MERRTLSRTSISGLLLSCWLITFWLITCSSLMIFWNSADRLSRHVAGSLTLTFDSLTPITFFLLGRLRPKRVPITLPIFSQRFTNQAKIQQYPWVIDLNSLGTLRAVNHVQLYLSYTLSTVQRLVFISSVVYSVSTWYRV